jgi:hypothetical protein
MFNLFEDEHKIKIKLAKLLPNLEWLNYEPRKKFMLIEKEDITAN